VNTIDAEGMEPHQNSPTISWQAPQSGTIKVNWNAAIDKNQGCISDGIITRDSNGFVVAVRSSPHFLFVDPVVAEAWATLQVVLFCKEIGLL
jgi:hypothetical protein